jgi:hypothetical protein
MVSVVSSTQYAYSHGSPKTVTVNVVSAVV